MRVLEYAGLRTERVQAQYQKVLVALARDDFRSAEIKKLGSAGASGSLYRAKLDYANRLLFTLVRQGDEVCALLLEVILNHDYSKSRFLRGAVIDEEKIPDIDPVAAASAAQPMRYLHAGRAQVQLLDKPISFDDTQFAIYQQPAPLIIVGSAGSGKTALTLEKLKQVNGEVLYVTHSAYLAQSARALYFGNGFEQPQQETSFLSYREFLETLRVPIGQEATWPRFSAWFARQQSQFRGFDAHQVFEEIRGVLTAQPQAVLSRDDYLALGIRQSIFDEGERTAVYQLFEKYRSWLAQEQLFDLNLLAHERLPLATARYDFVVVDEVQDLTAIQLALVLATLRKSGQFLLCGDSNQIVHPNFFSWSQVKSLFWRDPELAGRQQLSVLAANFRNASETTRLANNLLKIKHSRFGSIDRESNFLVRSVGAEAGVASLLADQESVTRELDRQTRQSTRVAVLVLRDADKAAARQRFATPLLFSVHEAKGLEYENVILYRFVSNNRSEFSEIVQGVSLADLEIESLDYRRARDKGDKSIEIYKFFVNALYVALTRATRNVYLIESDRAHPLFELLQIGQQERAGLSTQASSTEDWQREARRLELQGKQEQAESIRRDMLKQVAPPWPVFDEPRLRDTLRRVFREPAPGGKLQQQLLDYAAFHDAPELAKALAKELRFGSETAFEQQRRALAQKPLAAYAGKNFKEVLWQCEQYGTDHRTPSNLTPLMAAAASGNLPLVEALLDRGADPEQVDDYGQNALHWALAAAFARPQLAQGSFADIYERIAPASIDVRSGEKLLRIDRQLSEYLLLQTLWVLFRGRFMHPSARVEVGFDSAAVLAAWQHLPARVLRPERNKRAHLSGVLARNEVRRDYAYNRALFRRLRQGFYQFDPGLAVRVRGVGEESTWMPIMQRLNLPLVFESAMPSLWTAIRGLLGPGESQLAAAPIIFERAYARMLEERVRQQKIQDQQTAEIARLKAEQQRLKDERARLVAEHAKLVAQKQSRKRTQVAPAVPIENPSAAELAADPPWGTPEARWLAIERLRLQNEARRK